MTSLDNLGAVHVPQFKPTNTTRLANRPNRGAKGGNVSIFSHHSSTGIQGVGKTDFISFLNGVGMNLFPSNLVTSLTILSSGLEI